MNTKTLAEKFLEAAKFKAIVEIDYNDLDLLITEHFTGHVPPMPKGIKMYECACYEEWCNDSHHSFDVKKRPGDAADIENAKKGKWSHFVINELLNQMCYDGIIPECELLVHVSW